MTISETYEKFKHFDRLLSDREWLPTSIHGVLLHEFWMAIREAAAPKPLDDWTRYWLATSAALVPSHNVPEHPPITEYGGVDNDG